MTKGFTLIEVIAVLLLIAIISTVAYSRGSIIEESQAREEAEMLRSHIRYVQLKAINMDADMTVITDCNSSFGISLSSTGYFMFKNCNKNLKVVLPGANSTDISFTGTTLTSLSAGADTITFNTWGRPCSDTKGSTPFTADITGVLGGTEQIKITKNTGYVP
jgi:prepilin-type N-terminal cleavage/methylation domain-containing protein